MDSIHNVTDAILKDEGVHEDDVIVIHDAVRPLVTEKILNDSIDAAGTYGACVCGLPAVDTMLYSEDGKVVTTIPERSKLFNGQAPDSFSLPRFLEMQANLTEEQREVITGTSQICTMNNKPIYIIEGDPLNFKLPTDADLLIFNSIIDNIKVILERTPPELAADIYRQGIYLTGGACQVSHLAQLIASGTGLKVNVAEHPVESVALGLARVIKDDNYKSVAYAIEGMGNGGKK